MTLQIFEKDFFFPEKLFERYINGKLMKVNKVMKTLKISSDCHICRSFERRAILKIPSTIFLEESIIFLVLLKLTLYE